MQLSRVSSFCFLMLLVAAAVTSRADGWSPKKAALMTPWAAKVDPQNVLPEYPRPQMVRANWQNLNGLWEYQPGAADDAPPVGKKLSSEILVPFPVESALSGVMEHHDRLWYRRQFTVPAAWKGMRTILHFEAVDFESEVSINGKSVGTHHGGYDGFAYDITDAVKGDGPQELIVRVFDPTEAGGQPRGKQTTTGGHIMYAPTTGIWQTVWLEPVPTASIRDYHIVPDIDQGVAHVTVNLDGATSGHVAISAQDGTQTIATVEGNAGDDLQLKIPNAKLWSPDQPVLYGLTIKLGQDKSQTDSVNGYFGMRKISVGKDNGVARLFLNNKPLFQFGPLDQGFWPDGIYTAPTDDAIRNDIQQMKNLGFNMVRKHIKVEPGRWYYWTDHLGLLVWQDMPSANSYLHGDEKRPKVDVDEFESELHRLVQSHWNIPSIVMWVTFNEGQGQQAFDTPTIVWQVKTLDPSRLVDEASGNDIFGSGDVNDLHAYPEAQVRKITTPQAYVCGEFGGIGLKVEGHLWGNLGNGYANVSTSDDLLYLYSDFTDRVKMLRDTRGLSAAVYTQLTDVENEVNGLLTYDRQPKADVTRLAQATHFELPAPTYRTVLATSDAGTPQIWRYTTDHPPSPWNTRSFDDSKWHEGPAGFGKAVPLNNIGNTPWTTSDIWIRKHFTPGPLTAEQIESLMLRDFHDDDFQVFINGVPAYSHNGYVKEYERHSLSEEARHAIVANGDNVIAIHCLQKTGGQYIDAGIELREDPKEPRTK